MPTPYLKALVVNVQIWTETLYLCVRCCKGGMQMIAFSIVVCIIHHMREYLMQYFRTRFMLSKRHGDNSKTFW